VAGAEDKGYRRGVPSMDNLLILTPWDLDMDRTEYAVVFALDAVATVAGIFLYIAIGGSF